MKLSNTQRELFWILVPLAVITFAYLLRVVGYFTAIPGDLGDARFNNIILEHDYRWLIGLEPSLFTPRFFHPFTNTLGFSDNLFGSAPVYILFRALGFSRELAFDFWFLAGHVTNYLAAYVVCRRMGISPMGAAFGAFVFAYALPMLVKAGHAQLLYRFASPFALLAVWRLFERRRLIYLGAAAFWVAVQFYLTIYQGLFLLMLLAAFAVYLFVVERHVVIAQMLAGLRQEKRGALALSGTVFVVSAAATILLLAGYWMVARQYGFGRPIQVLAELSPRIGSYFVSDNTFSAVIGRLVQVPARGEQQLFLGAGVWLLIIAGTLAVLKGAEPNRLGCALGISALVLFLVTLNIDGLSLYLIVGQIPGISAIRAVSRVILTIMLPLGIIVGIGVDWMMQKERRTHLRTGFFALATLLVLVETAFFRVNISSFDSIREAVAPIVAQLPATLPPDAVLYVTASPDREPNYVTELNAMYVAQNLGIPTLNGYSGNFPRGHEWATPCVGPAKRLAAYRRLDDEREQTILPHVIYVALDPCVP